MNDELSKNIAKTLKRMLDASKLGDRKDFIDMGKEVEYFGYSKDYKKNYEGYGSREFQAKVNRTSEFVEVIGSELYPENPGASVNSREHATYWQKKRHKLEEQYIDYANEQGDLSVHTRRWVNQACVYGRGVLWAGYNESKRIVMHEFDTIENFGIDPDARTFEDVKYVWRKRTKPRWELSNMYPDLKDQIAKLPKAADRQTAPSDDPSTELVEYHEMFLKVGLAHYSSDLVMGDKITDDGQTIVDDSPMLYCFSDDLLLKAGDWPIPFWRDDMWPCTHIDLRERPGKLWPSAPMEPALPHLKALNLVYTEYMNRMKIANRRFLIFAQYNGQGLDPKEAIKILEGKDMDSIVLKINGDMTADINKYVQQFKLEAGIDELERYVALLSSEIEKSTGLYGILYAGDTGRQIRSATEADLKKQRSHSRIDEMKRQVMNATTIVLRKTLFGARYLQGPQEIAAFFGPQSGQLWGTLADPQTCQQENMLRMQAAQQIMANASMKAQQAAMNPQVQMTANGPAPVPPPPIVTAEDVEEMLGPPEYVSMDDWIHEADREIEAGSMRRMDHDAQVDNLNVALNQLAPAVVAMPGGAQFVAAIAEEFTIINRYSPKMQEAAAQFYKTASAPPPMPMPMPMETPPKGPTPQ